MAKETLFLLFVFSSSTLAYSQKIDSLESLLNRPDDTVKVNLLNDLSDLYWRKDELEKSESLAMRANVISKKIYYSKGVYWSTIFLYQNANAKADFINCINLLNKSLKIAEDLKKADLMAQSMRYLAQTYRDMHFYAKSFRLSQEAYLIALKLNDKHILAETLAAIAEAYSDNGNIELSNEYFLKEGALREELHELEDAAIVYSNIAENFMNQGNYKASIDFGKKAVEIEKKSAQSMNMAYLLAKLGNRYKEANDYENALLYFNKAISWHNEKYKSITTYAYCLLNISEIMLQRSSRIKSNSRYDYEKLIYNLENAIDLFKSHDRYNSLLRAYTAMEEIYERTGNFKMANEYTKKILATKDTLNSREQKAKVNELMIQYQVKENEQKIVQLQKEASTNNLIIILLAVLGTLGIFIVLLFINRQNLQYRNEKRELELTALRSQMNPHFIFNCLSSINLYIIQSEITEATDYLTKFAKLIRSILDNSKHSLVPLEEEIKTISLYLELEAVRFSNKFSYNIHVENKIDTESIKLAPMIIQPFIENAIWHGLQHKDGPGHIQITFAMRDKLLLCIIQDNGVGRQKALEFQRLGSRSNILTSKSHGIQITKERLNLLSRRGLKTSLEITDLVNGDNNPLGTKVEIALPIPKLS